jgi:hypothetical protein
MSQPCRAALPLEAWCDLAGHTLGYPHVISPSPLPICLHIGVRVFSGVADEFSDDAGDERVAVGVQFRNEFDELTADDPDEPVEVSGAGIGNGFAVCVLVDGARVDFHGDHATIAESGVVGIGGGSRREGSTKYQADGDPAPVARALA